MKKTPETLDLCSKFTSKYSNYFLQTNYNSTKVQYFKVYKLTIQLSLLEMRIKIRQSK